MRLCLLLLDDLRDLSSVHDLCGLRCLLLRQALPKVDLSVRELSGTEVGRPPTLLVGEGLLTGKQELRVVALLL